MQTATTALRVLDEVSVRQPIGVTEMAERLRMPKSSAQRALKSLEAAGWIRRTAQGGRRWVLTTKAIEMAQRVAADIGVRAAARAVMTDLRDATGESVHLAIREIDRVVVIDVVETLNPTRIHIPLGTRSPLHATATGKAILAHLDEESLGEIIAAGLPRVTDATITEPERLRRELERIRAGGRCAVANGELRHDISSIAAPVFSSSGAVLCAISVFIPSYRYPADGGDAISVKLLAAAEQVTKRL